MKRYPAFDPPEYVDWEPDSSLLDDYEATLASRRTRAELIGRLAAEEMEGLYRDLLRARLVDIGLHRWVRQGVISKAWLGTGEEAVTVGSVAALRRGPRGDVVYPMIRNAAALPMMGMPLVQVFRGYLATDDSPNGGRDLHIGDMARGVIQPISHMGTNVPVLAGVALAFRRSGSDRVALTWVGDGALRTAAFHEGVNFAAVQDLPLVVVIQNNQVALGTRLEQHGRGSVASVAEAYGLPQWSADGNNVLDVFGATSLAAARCRRGEGPCVVVTETFRMGSHATHDTREAREALPEELFRFWGARDPIGLFEEFLVRRGFDRDGLSKIEEEVIRETDAAATEALASSDRSPPPTDALYEGFSDGGPLVGLRGRLGPAAQSSGSSLN